MPEPIYRKELDLAVHWRSLGAKDQEAGRKMDEANYV